MDGSETMRARGAVPTVLRVLMIVGFVIALAATVLVVIADDVRLLRLGAVLALWAALVAAFAASRSRRDVKTAVMRQSEAQLAYELELQREVSARQEYEAHLTETMAAAQSEQIVELREQLDRLTEVLASLADGELLVSRLTLSAESARFRSGQQLVSDSAAELAGTPRGIATGIYDAPAVDAQVVDAVGAAQVAAPQRIAPERVAEAEPVVAPEPVVEVEPEPIAEPTAAVEPEPAPVAEPTAADDEPEPAVDAVREPASTAEPTPADEPARHATFAPTPWSVAPEPEPEPEPEPAAAAPRPVAAPAAEPPMAPIFVPDPAPEPSWQPAARVPAPIHAAAEPAPVAETPRRHSRHALADDATPPVLVPPVDLSKPPEWLSAPARTVSTTAAPGAPERAPDEREPSPLAPPTSVDELLAAYGLTGDTGRRRRGQ